MEINTVIVAEKPSVAGSIAPLVGASQRKTGYLYNPDTGTAVTWALGHLVRLSDPKAYGWEKWSLADLPMMPENFLLEVTDDPAVKARYAVVTSLMFEAQKIIVATDAGREGELIFRYIYGLSGCSTPFSRLWVSSLTDEAIRAGLAKLKPGNHYDNLFYAGKARSEADWLIGMNMTRAMTLKNAGGGVYSIGRVQTPTLGLIVNRFRDHEAFVPKPFYAPTIKLAVDGMEFSARWEQKLADVEHGELSYGEFLEQIRKYTRDLTELSSNLKVEFSHIAPDGKAGKCPFCGKPVRITKAGAGCTGWKKDEANSCRFFISRVICGAELSDEDLRRMLDGKPSKMHAMKSKAGKDFKAKIQLKNGRTDFIFADNTRKGKGGA